MLWLIFALLAASMTALSQILDKISVSKWFKTPWVFFSWWGIYSLFGAFVFLPFIPQLNFNIYAAFVGLLQVCSGYIYLRAIQLEDISRISPIAYTSPLIVLLLSTVFLGEVLTISNYAGILILVVGAMLMATHSLSKLRLSKGSQLMFLVAALLGIQGIFWKQAALTGSVPEVLFWFFLTYGVGNLLVTRQNAIAFVNRFGKLPSTAKILLLAYVPVSISAFVFNTQAISMQYISLISAVGASVPLFVFIFVALATLIVPKLLKEKLTPRIIITKLIGAALIIIGVYLVS